MEPLSVKKLTAT